MGTGARRSEIHLYVRPADRQAIEALPPDVSLSEVFRLGLRTHLAELSACSHPRARCTSCGALATAP